MVYVPYMRLFVKERYLHYAATRSSISSRKFIYSFGELKNFRFPEYSSIYLILKSIIFLIHLYGGRGGVDLGDSIILYKNEYSMIFFFINNINSVLWGNMRITFYLNICNNLIICNCGISYKIYGMEAYSIKFTKSPWTEQVSLNYTFSALRAHLLF